jgi:hypothetical protein
MLAARPPRDKARPIEVGLDQRAQKTERRVTAS